MCIRDSYDCLDETDKKSIWIHPTEKAKAYKTFAGDIRKQMYSEIAQMCEEYDRKHKKRDLER